MPPSVNAGASQTLYAGSAAQFNASVTDAGGPSQIASIQWDFNNNGTTFNADPSANGLTSPSHTYAAAGNYVVAVQATDVSGQTTEDFTTVTVKPTDALIVNAGTDLSATAGQSVSLSGSYTDPGGTVSASGIAWDSTYDGSTFTPTVTGTLTPNVTYASAGTYYAALQITDSTGAMDQSVVQVTVNPVSHVGPTANAGSDQTVNPGTNVSFSGSYTDPDGTVSSSGIAWDPNYDGVSFNPMMTGTLTPSYYYGTPGSYTVALQITDSNGLTSLSTLNLTVSSVAPTVGLQGPSMVTAGQNASFTATANLPPGDMDTVSDAWDFNYGGTFIPSSASGLTAQQVFATPGTYVVAFQASDSEGDSSLATKTVTVTGTTMLVVNAGPDQALSEGDTTTFSGSWTDGMGTVNTSTAKWDFNYTPGNFVADPSANGTLTPTHQFTTPGTYLVALQLTDSISMMAVGELYVSVSDVAPTASAGGDQTVNQNSTVSFTGTATQPAGVTSNPMSYAWDFDYGDHSTFTAMSTGTLTPTYTYTTPGTYEAALQVTDAFGSVGLDTATITVNDVPPTATVTNSGPANVGSPVTFTVSNIQDATLGDTPSYAVDWDGSGTFMPLSSDDLTVHQDGSVTFSNTYDTPSGPSGYNAVVQMTDGNGGVTQYTSNVVINAVAPTATVGPSAPSGNNGVIDATAPFVFGASDPSVSDTQAGFTYYVSLDGAAYTSSSSPTYQLPAGISTGQHTVTGYVTDSNGLSSTPVSWTGQVQAAAVTFINNGTGQVQINWTGSGGAVTLNANQSYQIAGTAPNFAVTLLTSGASYQLDTNGSIDSITAAAGVSGVSLTADTGVNYTSASMWVGDGHIGTVSLPGGGSTVSLYARGNLANITGPSSAGTQTGLAASNLVFANLTGSITGLDKIASLIASDWLGTSASQEVEAGDGIGSLTAYGVGATVLADERQDAGDSVLTVNVGAGGVPGVFEAGNVASVDIAGDANLFSIGVLEGTFDPPNLNRLTVRDTKEENNVPLLVKLKNVKQLIFDGKSPETVKAIKSSGTIGTLQVGQTTTITDNIKADAINAIKVDNGDLNIGGIDVTGAIGSITVGSLADKTGNLTVTAGGTRTIKAASLPSLSVGGNLSASIIVDDAADLTYKVGGNFLGGVNVLKPLEAVQLIDVGGKFTTEGTATNVLSLVRTPGDIDTVKAKQGLGDFLGGEPHGSIQGRFIGTIESTTGDIKLANITSTNGWIKNVVATGGTLYAKLYAENGNIYTVDVKQLKADVRATSSADLNEFGKSDGNIFYIHSTDAIPDITIFATWYIGKIKVDNGGAVEKFKVYADAGQAYDASTGAFTGAGPLIIDVGTAKFEGSVTFTTPPKGLADTYTGGTSVLLSVTATVGAAKVTTTWKVTGTGTGTINDKVKLVFKMLKGGVFGWVKTDDPFSDDNLSIGNGPVGTAS